jgi:hypothetical protein
VLAYVKQHGGGTIAVESQSNAASSIVEQDANVAGIGGFSGRESDVSISWLAQEVRSGKITWVLVEDEASGSGAGATGTTNRALGAGGAFGVGGTSHTLGAGARPTETRTGSRKAMAAVKQACVAVSVSSSGSSTSSAAGSSSAAAGTTLYDCHGRAAELQRVGTQQSSS